MSSQLTLILDTNVVLDWLVFKDPTLQTLNDAVQIGRVLLQHHSATLDELRRVLNYPALKLNAGRQTELFAQYLSITTTAIAPSDFSPLNLLTPPGFPICRDYDDQVFLALALHGKVDALVSRDRAALAVRKRAAKFGVTIMDIAQLNKVLAR